MPKGGEDNCIDIPIQVEEEPIDCKDISENGDGNDTDRYESTEEYAENDMLEANQNTLMTEETAFNDILEDANQRRFSSRTKKPPSRYMFETNLVLKRDPESFEEALSCTEEKENWMEALKDEMLALEENSTWKLVNSPSDCKPIKCKWVFKRKRDESGAVIKYKARLVAKGYTQIYERD